MEELINLLTLDSQPSSLILSEKNLVDVSRTLQSCSCLDRNSFFVLIQSIGSKLNCLNNSNVPKQIYTICGLLFKHIFNREEVQSDEIGYLFSKFIEPLSSLSTESFVKTYECILQNISENILDIDFNIFLKCSVLSSLNEISTISSSMKVELFLNQNIQRIYSLFASELREIGDYDTQIQILELLLRVIPAAKRKQFAENHFPAVIAEAFCATIGGQFEPSARNLLNKLNKFEPMCQRVFSLPCSNIRLCDIELTCSPISLQGQHTFWLDFNLIPERLTTYCLPSDEQNLHTPDDQTWETLFVQSEAIADVNVGSIILEDGATQIILSITTREPITTLFSWAPKSATGNNIEFVINPSEVCNILPSTVDFAQLRKLLTTPGQTEWLQLLTGLKNYAETLVAPHPSTSSSMSLSASHNRFVSCKSPIYINVFHPPAKSFFRDQDVSFEESAEGLGKSVTPGPFRSIQNLNQSAISRTPVSINVLPKIQNSVSSSIQNYVGFDIASNANMVKTPALDDDLAFVGSASPKQKLSDLQKHTKPPPYEKVPNVKVKISIDSVASPISSKTSNSSRLSGREKRSKINAFADIEELSQPKDHNQPSLDEFKVFLETSQLTYQEKTSSVISEFKEFIEENKEVCKDKTIKKDDVGVLINEMAVLLGENLSPQQRLMSKNRSRVKVKSSQENLKRKSPPPIRRRSARNRTSRCTEKMPAYIEIDISPIRLDPFQTSHLQNITNNIYHDVDLDSLSQCNKLLPHMVENKIHLPLSQTSLQKNEPTDILEEAIEDCKMPISQADLLEDSIIVEQINVDKKQNKAVVLQPVAQLFTSHTSLESATIFPSSEISATVPPNCIRETQEQDLNEKRIVTQTAIVAELTALEDSPEQQRTASLDIFSTCIVPAKRLEAMIPCINEPTPEQTERKQNEASLPLSPILKPSSGFLIISPAPDSSHTKPATYEINDSDMITPVHQMSQKVENVQLMEEIMEQSKEEDEALFSSPTTIKRSQRCLNRRSVVSFANTLFNENDESSMAPDTASRSVNQSTTGAPSPMSTSPFARLEAAVNELEANNKDVDMFFLDPSQNDGPSQVALLKQIGGVAGGVLQPAKRLCNMLTNFLEEKSPLAPSQEVEPRHDGLLVPILGKTFNLRSKSRLSNKLELSLQAVDQPKKKKAAKAIRPAKKSNISVKVVEVPLRRYENNLFDMSPVPISKIGTARRPRKSKAKNSKRSFFTTTFADRRKKEEERFFEVCGGTSNKTTASMKAKAKKQDKLKIKSVMRNCSDVCEERIKSQLSYLEDTNSPYPLPKCALRSNGSGRLQSRPAVRKAAAMARKLCLLPISDDELLSISDDDDNDANIAIDDSDVEEISSRPKQTKKNRLPNSKNAAAEMKEDTFCVPSSDLSSSTNYTAQKDSFEPSALFQLTPSTSLINYSRFEDKFEKENLNYKSSNISSKEKIPLACSFKIPKSYSGLFSDMSECISTFFRLLTSTESEVTRRLKHLRHQAEMMQRLVNWSLRQQESQNE